MHVRVVSLAQCEATPATLRLVRHVANDMGVDIELEHVVIHNADEARQYRHVGSPTVQVNSVDIEPEARNTKRFGLG